MVVDPEHAPRISSLHKSVSQETTAAAATRCSIQHCLVLVVGKPRRPTITIIVMKARRPAAATQHAPAVAIAARAAEA